MYGLKPVPFTKNLQTNLCCQQLNRLCKTRNFDVESLDYPVLDNRTFFWSRKSKACRARNWDLFPLFRQKPHMVINCSMHILMHCFQIVCSCDTTGQIWHATRITVVNVFVKRQNFCFILGLLDSVSFPGLKNRDLRHPPFILTPKLLPRVSHTGTACRSNDLQIPCGISLRIQGWASPPHRRAGKTSGPSCFPQCT
jgi:hypothetical protein